ncbi:hypothetical protein [Aliikangiella coralliicola]|uniref:Uncharacterized protein n=1 Tax=Aliikangiella coralliicola TaxID=2592383 RepID=A0A545UGT3_9GAMM|nr:hypothetical protein [Aliikangiella coralliicola]TQV88613.1 hypothetical protein FLL46_08850 [Aliikangiella coralliicola]
MKLSLLKPIIAMLATIIMCGVLSASQASSTKEVILSNEEIGTNNSIEISKAQNRKKPTTLIQLN